MASAVDGTVDRPSLVRGAVAGVVTSLLGYVLVYAWKAPVVDDALRGINTIAEMAGGQAIPTWKAVGWLFFNAHAVATRVPALGGGHRTLNLITESDDGSLVLLYGLVAFVLLLAGTAVARYGSSDRVGQAAASGATVVVGYLPAAVVATLLVGHSLGGDVRVAPDLVTAVAVAGVVYPAFLGALGGAVSHWIGATLST